MRPVDAEPRRDQPFTASWTAALGAQLARTGPADQLRHRRLGPGITRSGEQLIDRRGQVVLRGRGSAVDELSRHLPLMKAPYTATRTG